MRVVIAGSSGLIGSSLRDSLTRSGDTVVRLVRRPPRSPDEAQWDPGAVYPGVVDGADLVVNLAGAGLGDRRWTRRYQDLILRSRTESARTLATAAAQADNPPRAFLSASGIRFYGIDRGDEVLTEDSEPSTAGLLPRVAQEWEAATAPASEAGIRVCNLRIGLVLSRHGGVLARMAPLFRTGLGAYFVSGREYWSYVSLTDTVRAIRFLAERPEMSGPYNITAPEPVRNERLMRALAAAVGVRAVVRAPNWALRVALGKISTEVFGGLRVLPARLTEAGFEFRHPTLELALRDALHGA